MQVRRSCLCAASSSLSQCCSLRKKGDTTSHLWIINAKRGESLVHHGKNGESSHGDGTKGSVDSDGAATLRSILAVTVAAAARATVTVGGAAVAVGVASVLALGHAVAKVGVGCAGGRAPLRARAVETRRLAGTVLDQLLGLFGDLGKVVGAERPVLALGGAVKVVASSADLAPAMPVGAGWAANWAARRSKSSLG